MALLSTIAPATDGYITPGPLSPIAIAARGLILSLVITETPDGGGGSPVTAKEWREKLRRRLEAETGRQFTEEEVALLHREDDEVLSIFMLAVIYGYLE